MAGSSKATEEAGVSSYNYVLVHIAAGYVHGNAYDDTGKMLESQDFVLAGSPSGDMGAGAWTLPDGTGQMLATIAASTATSAFDDNTNLTSIPRYNKLDAERPRVSTARSHQDS